MEMERGQEIVIEMNIIKIHDRHAWKCFHETIILYNQYLLIKGDKVTESLTKSTNDYKR